MSSWFAYRRKNDHGRALRADQAGQVQAIVEHKDASAAQRAIAEGNTGILAVPGSRLADCADPLTPVMKKYRGKRPPQVSPPLSSPNFHGVTAVCVTERIHRDIVQRSAGLRAPRGSRGRGSSLERM